MLKKIKEFFGKNWLIILIGITLAIYIFIIDGRFNNSKNEIASLKSSVSSLETIIANLTKPAINPPAAKVEEKKETKPEVKEEPAPEVEKKETPPATDKKPAVKSAGKIIF